jgi:hypothetical protein
MKEPAFSKYVKDLKESLGFMKEPLVLYQFFHFLFCWVQATPFKFDLCQLYTYIPSLTSNEGLVQNQRTAQQWLELRTL